MIFLKLEHEEEIIKKIGNTFPLGLIRFAFDCWSKQGFKDANGKPIPKKEAIPCIKNFSENWENWLIKTSYHKYK